MAKATSASVATDTMDHTVKITHARQTLVTMVERVWCSTLFTCVNVPEPTEELDAIC